MAWTDRLTLVAIQFGLTFEIAADGRSVRLVPVPAKVTARRSFPAGHDQRQNAGLLAQRYPETVVKVEGDQIVVDGRIEDLETVARGIAAAGRPVHKTAPAGKQVYKLSVEHSLDDLLAQLSKLLDVEFQLDRPAIERAGIALDQIVTAEGRRGVARRIGFGGARAGRTEGSAAGPDRDRDAQDPAGRQALIEALAAC